MYKLTNIGERIIHGETKLKKREIKKEAMDPEKIIKNAGGLENYYHQYDEVFESEKVKRSGTSTNRGRFKLPNLLKSRDSILGDFFESLNCCRPSKKV